MEAVNSFKIDINKIFEDKQKIILEELAASGRNSASKAITDSLAPWQGQNLVSLLDQMTEFRRIIEKTHIEMRIQQSLVDDLQRLTKDLPQIGVRVNMLEEAVWFTFAHYPNPCPMGFKADARVGFVIDGRENAYPRGTATPFDDGAQGFPKVIDNFETVLPLLCVRS